MTCHVGRSLDEIFLFQIVHQPNVEGMRGFGCAREFGKHVAGQGTLAFVIERVGRGAIEILYVMDRPSSHAGEECVFRDALGVEVGKTCHCLIEDCMQLSILYVVFDPIYAVL